MKPEQLAKQFEAAAAELRNPRDTMQRIVLTVLPPVQKRTPVLSGRLRRSETTRVEAAGQRGVVGTNVIYAPYVHKRQPFLHQGLDDAQSDIGRILERTGEKILGHIG